MTNAIFQEVEARLAVVARPQVQLALDFANLEAADLRRRLGRESRENPFVALSWPRKIATLNDAPSSPAGLFDHALKQARLCTRPNDWPIVLAFIEALGEAGWLEKPVADIAVVAGVPRDQAERVLQLLQTSEPTGLFARSLSDCLRLQAAERGFLDPTCEKMLEDLSGFERLGLNAWADSLGIPRREVSKTLDRLRELDPKPGAQFQSTPLPVRIPDVIVRRDKSGWVVSLNCSLLPDVTIKDERKTALSPRAAVRARQKARYLEQAVRLRNQAVLTVAEAMVRHQSDFLLHGPRAQQPLTRQGVAIEIGFHASTVGRICTGLLFDTPRGVIGAEDFFSPALQQDQGQSEVSAAAMRAVISELIARENTECPLSDQAISEQLGTEGLRVARRTVQKYRSMLGIRSARERKRRVPAVASSSEGT